MQVGGNAKARAFFRSNGGDVSDKAVKYSSRAANLYKAKIAKLAEDALKKYQGQLHIGNVVETAQVVKSKEDDFFGNFDNAELKQTAPAPAAALLIPAKSEPKNEPTNGVNGNIDKLTVDLTAKATLKPATAKKVTKLGGNKSKSGGKKSAFGGVKKVSSSTFNETAAAAEREEKEIKVYFIF